MLALASNSADLICVSTTLLYYIMNVVWHTTNSMACNQLIDVLVATAFGLAVLVLPLRLSRLVPPALLHEVALLAAEPAVRLLGVPLSFQEGGDRSASRSMDIWPDLGPCLN